MNRFNPFTGTLDIIGEEVKPTEVADLATWAGRFDKDYIVGTESSPTSGNITYNFTGAVKGSESVAHHNSSTVPSFPSTTRIIWGMYIPNVLNLIQFIYISDSIVYVIISQPTSVQIPLLVPSPYQLVQNTHSFTGGSVIAGSATSAVGSDNILGAYESFTIAAVNEARGRQSSTSSFLLADQCDWVASFNIRINLLSTGTDRFIAFAGLASTASNPQTANDSVGVIYSDDINAGKLQLRISKTGASNNTEDLGITVTAGGVYEIVMQNIIGTGLKVWVNGVLTGTYDTTNMPDGSIRNMVIVTKTVGTTSIQPIDNASFNIAV